MQRAAAIASFALRRLAAAASARPSILARVAFSRRLGSSLDFYRPMARLLPPVDAPSRGYARRREVIPSDDTEKEDEDLDDEEDLSGDFDEEEDLDGDFDDGEGDVDGDWSEFDVRGELTDESD
ncbi:hypothetical protein OPV22_023465 [Ensete ventricosum]|uniref:Uncharacterized protein n=1 Tax=Ensete ventricosum TaxID=4639 RepID=A0AAV8QS39_ENSVE|nr:hypothetical protein OPV22_023465 [Ensete ventricosum]RWW22130.1 hypothetical protein GW17_00013688 [Ensete ventricosum]